MKIAIHHNTFKKIANGEIDQIVSHFALSSKITFTPAILASYHQELAQNHFFTAWFASAQTQKRIDVVNPAESPSHVKNVDFVVHEYGTASYFAGSNLLLSLNDFDPAAIISLESIGTNFVLSNSPLPSEIHGDNPFHIINTNTNGNIGFSALDQYIKPEDCITIYDRYINNISIELIEYIASQLKPGSTLSIFHSDRPGKNLLNSSQILSRASTANPHISVTCQLCTKKFVIDNHDRYIFFGNRCQATFTAGLDCFGSVDTTTGRRVNRKSTIAFFDTSKSGILKIEGKDGSRHIVRHYAA